MASPDFILWRQSDRWVVVVAALLAIILGAGVSLLYVVFTTARVEGGSMVPTLYDGDRVLISKHYEVPVRGDVVSAVIPDEAGRAVEVLKRVVAVGGDTVEARSGVVYVNGVAAVSSGRTASPAEPDIPEFTLSAGTVYLLGDDRLMSYDSRQVGPVALQSIRGRVEAIILPLSRFSIIG